MAITALALAAVTLTTGPGTSLAQDEDGAASDTASVDLTDVNGQSALERLRRPRWIDPLRGDGSAASNEAGETSESTSGMTDAIPSGASADWRGGGDILVHGKPAAERLSEVVEALLRRQGAETVERREVEISATTDQVRYFHADDAARAASLAETLEPVFGEVRVRDLTTYRPAPPPGSLEVWLR